jgi:hypothetical protein
LIRAFFDGLREGKPPIPYEEIFLSHRLILDRISSI